MKDDHRCSISIVGTEAFGEGGVVHSDGNHQQLVKRNKVVDVGFKRSSLFAVGCINMILQDDDPQKAAVV